MICYTPLVKQTLKLAYDAHKDQLDKSGLPYIYHPLYLAEQMTEEYTMVVALLHDVVEDTNYTIDDLRQMGYPEQVVDAVLLLTHEDGVPYMDYIAKIKENRIARIVKIADLRHNSDLCRLDVVDEKALCRIDKYKKALKVLSDVEETEEEKMISNLYDLVIEIDARCCSSNSVISNLHGVSWNGLCNQAIDILGNLKNE